MSAMLDSLDLTHMNGRVYDQITGRFLSAAPFVQAPFDGQSLNRYSYVFNNPLSLIDPSGFSADDPPASGEQTNGGGSCGGRHYGQVISGDSDCAGAFTQREIVIGGGSPVDPVTLPPRRDERKWMPASQKKLLDLLIGNALRILTMGFGVNWAESSFFDVVRLLRQEDPLKEYFLERVRATLSMRNARTRVPGAGYSAGRAD